MQNADSVPQVIAERVRFAQEILYVLDPEFVPPANALRTTTPVEIEYAAGQRRASSEPADFLVFYWEVDGNRLARQLSSKPNTGEYFLELLKRTPTSQEAYLPQVTGNFTKNFTQAQLYTHSSYALGDGIVYKPVVGELSWAPVPNEVEATDYTLAQGETTNNSRILSALRVFSDGSGSLNQSQGGRTLETIWSASGGGSYTIFNESGQIVKTGSY
jgi:hypothetical protein